MMKKDCTLVVEVVDMLNENKIKIFHCFWSGEEGGGGGVLNGMVFGPGGIWDHKIIRTYLYAPKEFKMIEVISTYFDGIKIKVYKTFSLLP